MLFNTVISMDTSTSTIHNIGTCTLCLLILLLSFMTNNILGNIANSNSSNSTLFLVLP